MIHRNRGKWRRKRNSFTNVEFLVPATLKPCSACGFVNEPINSSFRLHTWIGIRFLLPHLRGLSYKEGIGTGPGLSRHDGRRAHSQAHAGSQLISEASTSLNSVPFGSLLPYSPWPWVVIPIVATDGRFDFGELKNRIAHWIICLSIY